MTGSTIATRQVGALTIAGDQQEFTEAQLEAFGLRGATRGEQLVFLHTSQRTGLDPAARQIYSIARQESYKDDNDQWQKRTVRTIQTGIDGYRLIARRAADGAGQAITYGPTEWCGQDGVWHDVWLSADPPAAARVTVYRDGQACPGVAIFREYAQTKRNGSLNSMWERMPANQIAKCAEALALRKAFPQELAAIYTDEEMGSATEHPARPVAARSAFAKPAADDVVDAEVVPETGELIDTRSDLMKRLHATLREAFASRDEGYAYVGTVIGRDITSTSELTVNEASRVIDDLTAAPADAEPRQ